MKLSPEMDELMWRLAESEDGQALDAFVAKHPELRPEMTKRLRMVRGLRGSRPKRTTPAFVPKRGVSAMPPPSAGSRSWGLAVAALGIFSVAFATFAVVKYTETLTPSPVASQGGSTGASPQNPAPRSNPTPSGPPPIQNSSSDPGNGGAGSTVPVVPAKTDSRFDAKVTVVVDRASLSEVLDDVAKQAGVVLSPAPGMPDPDIKADYQEASAIAVLQDLGHNFGFTAMIQGDRVALLIPARDKSRKYSPPVFGGQGSRPLMSNDSGGLPPVN